MAPPRDPFKVDLLPGTLDLLLLQTLSLGPMHGYGIAQHIGRMSEEALRVEEGSLYPALQRLKLKGWVKAEWRMTPPASSMIGTKHATSHGCRSGLLVAAMRSVLRPA